MSVIHRSFGGTGPHKDTQMVREGKHSKIACPSLTKHYSNRTKYTQLTQLRRRLTNKPKLKYSTLLLVKYV